MSWLILQLSYAILLVVIDEAAQSEHQGEIPTIRIGKRILVLRQPLKRLLGGVA